MYVQVPAGDSRVRRLVSAGGSSVQSEALGMCVHGHGRARYEERTKSGSRLESACSCPGQAGSGHVGAGACRRQVRVVGM